MTSSSCADVIAEGELDVHRCPGLEPVRAELARVTVSVGRSGAWIRAAPR